MDTYYVSIEVPRPGNLVKFVVGEAADKYGILVVKKEETVVLDNCMMIDKKWLVITPVGIFWCPEYDFYVV